VIFLSFYSGTGTCPQYLSATSARGRGHRLDRSMEKRAPPLNYWRSGLGPYDVGLIPHLFLFLGLRARDTRRIGATGIPDETIQGPLEKEGSLFLCFNYVRVLRIIITIR
jgi:hypothetical protein